MLLPTGTVGFNQAAGLCWFTVALRIKIGCKELLESTATQLQVMVHVWVCIDSNVYVYMPEVKHLPQYVLSLSSPSVLWF